MSFRGIPWERSVCEREREEERVSESFRSVYGNCWQFPMGNCQQFPYTGWRRLIGCLQLRVIFCKRATNYRAFLHKITYTNKAFYDLTPPCIPCTHVYSYKKKRRGEVEKFPNNSVHIPYTPIYTHIHPYTPIYTRIPGVREDSSIFVGEPDDKFSYTQIPIYYWGN